MARFASREEYEAWKAGQGPGGGSPMTAAPAAAAAARTGFTPLASAPAAGPPKEKKKESLKEAFSGVPAWAWPFIAACFAIPLMTLGGALPTGLGFGAAAGCAQVSKKPDWDTLPKVVTCAGIAGGAWILVLALVAALASRR